MDSEAYAGVFPQGCLWEISNEGRRYALYAFLANSIGFFFVYKK